jgi:hypothetical protein
MIAASVIATSSTGGNVAGPGVVIQTGDAYASSNVTVVSSGEGTSTIDIRTNVNGRVSEEHRVVPNTNGARVEVSVTATSGPAQVEVHVAPATASTTASVSWIKKLFGWGPKLPVATTTASSSVETPKDQTSASVFVRITAWFSNFWSLFK